MKITFKDGQVVAVAESLGDVERLMVMCAVVTKKHRKHKKHAFMKVCGRCGKEFKGKQGLAVHQAKCLKTKIAEPVMPLEVKPFWKS